MGVGDYVHSKEARQHQPRTNEPSNQSRQALAEQVRVEIPPTTLVSPVPISANGQAPLHRYGSPFHEPPQAQAEKPPHRDVFDTDVEGIDDSTIAGTSVIGIDEIPIPYRFSPAPNIQHQEIEQQQEPQRPQPSPSPPRQFRHVRRSHDSKWYEGLGDRALKSAGFDLDDADDTSQLTSTAGDDEQSNDTDDQRFVPRYRTDATEEPLSRRLQNFWSASRRSYQNNDPAAHAEPSKPHPSFIPVASVPKALPPSSRKVTLTRSMTTTPRTRFSPPKPSLLEQLDLTPTRRSPGTGIQLQKETSKVTDDADNGLGLFTGDHGQLDSFHTLNAFDLTNLDDLDDDPVNDPFSRRASVKRIGPDTSRMKKRHLEPDYPPEILSTKTFAELQAEPFDHTPAPAPSAPKPATEPTQSSPRKGKEEDKISFLLRLSDEECRDFFAKLSMDEWEDHGDLLIEQFSKMLTKMKELRHARRRTAAVFEAEIKRRHDLVEEQSAELSTKFEEMRAGGAEVLRGRTP